MHLYCFEQGVFLASYDLTIIFYPVLICPGERVFSLLWLDTSYEFTISEGIMFELELSLKLPDLVLAV